MSLKMTREERETFLADLHVGVISIDEPGRGPLTVPIWYDYSPEIGVWVVTEEGSRKGKLLRNTSRFSICAQVEAPPLYQYVSVEGPITAIRPSDVEKEVRPMAHRYFGPELGDQYVGDGTGEGQITVVMKPERWLTVDYAKLGGGA